jgi:glucokinase
MDNRRAAQLVASRCAFRTRSCSSALGELPRLMGETGSVIAMDVGGSAIKGALIDVHGRTTAVVRRPTERVQGPDAVVERILATAVELRDQLGEGARAAGVAVPGFVDQIAGVARSASNIGWHEVPLRAMLEERLGIPVVLGHDGRAGGLAEGLLGGARGFRDYFFLSIGTGIGGAMVLGGRSYQGRDGFAGEIGHVVVRPDGPRCRCGARGCLEAIASAGAIADRYATVTGDPAATAELVVERAYAGDADAEAIWRDAVEALAAALAAYTVLLAPEAIVIGGGLALAGDALFSPLARSLARKLTLRPAPQLVAAELGDEAGCLGAGLSAWLALGVSEHELRWNGAA